LYRDAKITETPQRRWMMLVVSRRCAFDNLYSPYNGSKSRRNI